VSRSNSTFSLFETTSVHEGKRLSPILTNDAGGETHDTDEPLSDQTSPTERQEAEADLDIEALFRKHYPHLRRYGERLTSNASLVEDAIQDVFLSLCDRSSDAAPITSPRSYLLTALRRRILDRLDAAGRRRSRQKKYVLDEPTFAVSRNDVMAAHEWMAERREALAQALDTLSDRRREALYLRFYHGLSHREIATVMDIRRQSARNYVSEALIHLREMV